MDDAFLLTSLARVVKLYSQILLEICSHLLLKSILYRYHQTVERMAQSLAKVGIAALSVCRREKLCFYLLTTNTYRILDLTYS